jgi:hypothetical protein
MSNINRIAALLAMAESTTNEHEADAFLKKAQQLATNASVDLAMARAQTARKEAREKPISKTIAVGELRQRANKHLVELFIQLGWANDLQMDIAHNSTYVIAYGMPSDIEVTEMLFNSVSTQMVVFANEWIRSKKWQDDTYFGSKLHKSGYKIPVRKKHTAATARGAFYAAFIKRVAKRVQEARTEVIKERTKQDNSTNETKSVISTALVLREKTAEVKDFHKQTSNARGKWSGYSGAGASGKAGKSSIAGTEAGGRAHIGAQKTIPGGIKKITK